LLDRLALPHWSVSGRSVVLCVLLASVGSGLASIEASATVSSTWSPADMAASAVHAAVTAPDFAIENAVPGAGFNNPAAIVFTPDGRILVAEKRGVVRVVENGVKRTQPLWSGETEVLSNGDRGLLGIAVDPGYTTNRWVYLLYVVDPDSNGVDDDDDGYGRLTRYRTSASDPNVLDLATRQVLIGTRWNEGFVSGGPSHAVGALRWGADGTLLVSFGDGAQYAYADAGGHDPGLFLPGRFDSGQDIGAYRAQDLASLNGKILRIDPSTGGGIPSNPWFDGDPRSNRSRVWVYGCRNPFRFSIRPNTGASDPAAGDPGTLYIGDVGWNQWDELNVSPEGGENWGWPCWEGTDETPYRNAAPPSHHGCSTLGTVVNPRLPSPPTLRVSLLDPAASVPAGLAGRCLIGGVFYAAGFYPSAYRGRYFFGDFSSQWIKTASFGANDEPTDVQDFASEVDGPVDFALDPVSGDVHFVAIGNGFIYRIRYTGPIEGNSPPTAVAASDVRSGTAPLAVHFSSAGTNDPDLDPLVLAWSFGDGATSSQANPEHVYAAAGQYLAFLTVTDGRGGLARDTVSIAVLSGAAFPSTATVDDFERADGVLGGAWIGSVSGLRIAGGALTQTATTSYAIWNGATFGPDQEAWATFGAVTDSAEHDLLFKVQGPSWQDGHVQIHYDTKYQGVIVLTYDRAGGWKRVGGPFAMRLDPGDRLGGRVTADGTVQVFENGALAGVASTGSWPFAANGGRLGLLLARASTTRMSAFGGGNLVSNRPPIAVVDAPPARSFYVTGDTLRLDGAATDLEDPADSLTFRWEVDLHHNVHVHPSFVVADGPHASFVAADHDDGTGVWMRARLIVTDTDDASDTTSVDLFPHIDLRCSAVGTVPGQPGTGAPTEYRFTIDNFGNMPAPRSRWRLVANGQALAEGDTLVPASGRVFVSRTLPPLLAPGSYDLRIVADTLGAVVETDEANNGETRRLVVVAGQGVTDVTALPRVLALSSAYPNPARAGARLDLDLPRAASVGIAVFDVQGREVWRRAPHPHPAGHWTLAWSGRTARGATCGAGLYLARIRVDGQEWVRRIAVVP
jgi:glucose/arabinose dehydrogenase